MMTMIPILLLFLASVVLAQPDLRFVDCYDATQNTTTVINNGQKDRACATNPHCDCGLCTKLSNANTSRQLDEYCVILSTNTTELYEKGFICPRLNEEEVEQCKLANNVVVISLVSVSGCVVLVGIILLCLYSDRCKRQQKKATQYDQL